MDSILEKVKEARKGSKQRKFEQTWDFFVNLKSIDLKKPENRLDSRLVLPKKTGRQIKVVVFADTIAAEAKKHADLVLSRNDIERLAGDKKALKKLINDYDSFFGEVTLMAQIGKSLGVVMGPRGKVPKPIPPKVKVEPIIQNAKDSVRILVKDNPVVHVNVGKEKMDDQSIADNAEAVLNFLKEKLPKGFDNIKSAHIKLTMGKPVRINVR